MRALQVRELTGPDGVELVDVPDPEPSEGVLVDVEVAGVSFPDLLLSRGRYQVQQTPPFVPGFEVAGVVRSSPEDSPFSPGDRVMALASGGYAERAVAVPHLTFPVPDSFSVEQAGGFVMNYHTAHFALHRRGRLREGEVVLVHGAAGGLGSAIVQVARAFGGRVIAAVSNDAKEEVARRAGAEEVVRSDGDWLGAVKDLTGGRGVSMVADPVGGQSFLNSVRALAPEGRVLVLGFAGGHIPTIAVNRLLLRNVDVVGVMWGGFAMEDEAMCTAIGADLQRMADQGLVDPIVGDAYPLAEGARALRQLEGRGALGKIVLLVTDPGANGPGAGSAST